MLVLAGFLVAIGLNIHVTAADESPRAAEAKDSELESIREQMQKILGRIDSFHATTKSYHVDSPGSVVWRECAAKGESRYMRIWHDEFETAENDPDAIARFYHAGEFNYLWPYAMWYEVTSKYAGLPYTNKIHAEFYYETTGLWPASDKTTPPMSLHGDPIYLPTILTDARLRLEDDRDSVDGHPCHVLELPDVVKLWVDQKLYCVRRRDELVDPSRVGKSDYAKEAASYRMRDFREVSPGVLLPFEIRRSFASPRGSTIHIVTECVVNHVADELFEYDVRPGDLLVDRDTDTIRQAPGGLERMEILMARAMKSSNIDVDHRRKLADSLPLLLIGHIAGIVTYVVFAQMYKQKSWTA